MAQALPSVLSFTKAKGVGYPTCEGVGGFVGVGGGSLNNNSSRKKALEQDKKMAYSPELGFLPLPGLGIRARVEEDNKDSRWILGIHSCYQTRALGHDVREGLSKINNNSERGVT